MLCKSYRKNSDLSRISGINFSSTHGFLNCYRASRILGTVGPRWSFAWLSVRWKGMPRFGPVASQLTAIVYFFESSLWFERYARCCRWYLARDLDRYLSRRNASKRVESRRIASFVHRPRTVMANKNTNFWGTPKGGIYRADMIDMVERPPKHNGTFHRPLKLMAVYNLRNQQAVTCNTGYERVCFVRT